MPKKMQDQEKPKRGRPRKTTQKKVKPVIESKEEKPKLEPLTHTVTQVIKNNGKEVKSIRINFDKIGVQISVDYSEP